MQKIKDAKAKMQKMEHKMSNQLRKKTSPTTIALKKIDIVTSMHIDEPQWDIVLEITDMCNRDIKLAKQVLKHLLFLLQESIEISLDNQQLYNCLTVIDSLARNGNKNVLTVIHQTYLEALARLANMAETEEKQKSLLQSDKKTCRIRVLELIMSWGRDFDPTKYPNFYKTYSKLKMEGLPFNLVEKSNLVPVRAPTNISNNNDNNDNNNNNNRNASNIANGNINSNNNIDNRNNHNNNNNNNENNEENDEKKIDPKYLSPWEQKHMEFGKWYKKKLKHDLKQLAEMCCMVQDVIAIKNAEDASFLCMELRESNRRLVGLMLRTDDAEAVSIMLQWITIIAGLLQCVQKLQSGQHVQVPGITKESLDMLIDNEAPAPVSTSQDVDLFDMGAPPATSPTGVGGPSDQSVMSYMSAPTQAGFASPPPQTQPFSSPPPQAGYGGAPPPPQQAYPGAPPPPQPYYPGAPPSHYGAQPQQPVLALPSSQPGYGAPAPPPAGPAQPSYYGGPAASLIPPASAPAPQGGGYFAPATHAVDDPFAPRPPTSNDIANEIMKGYSMTPPSPMQVPDVANGAPPSQQQAPPAQVNLSMNGLAITSGEEEENLSDFEKAMRKLVNVDHIDEPAEEQMKLTMKKKEDVTAQKNKHKSKPLPPVAKSQVGSAATLRQISDVKPKVTSPKEGIMKAPPQPWNPEAAAAGMLVVHGSQNGGPPPLQPRGFGVVHGQGHSYAYGQGAPQMMYGGQQAQYQPQQQGYQYR